MSELFSTKEDPVVKEELPDEVKYEPDSWGVLTAEPSEAPVKDEVDLGPIKLMPVDMQYVMRSCKEEEIDGGTERGEELDKELQDSKENECYEQTEDCRGTKSSEGKGDSEDIDKLPDSNSFTALRAQLESGTGKKQQPDTLCSDSSTSQEALTSHLTDEINNGGLHSCSICKIKFKFKVTLQRHLRTHDNVMTCKDCQKYFNDFSEFERHQKWHLNAVHCEICNRYFSRNQINLHMTVTHAPSKPFKCDICEKTFAIKRLLCRHMLCHHNKRFEEATNPYMPVKRVSRTYKVTHAATPEVIKPEVPRKCNICKKTFALKANYYSHINTHLTEPTLSQSDIETDLK